ncbi:MAG TPA: hypothetical protein PKY59_23310 [Pyrinomonadaceae bacterium]|nr:hypothetical protein [Pyrinomonadaceae bacterium]
MKERLENVFQPFLENTENLLKARERNNLIRIKSKFIKGLKVRVL